MVERGSQRPETTAAAAPFGPAVVVVDPGAGAERAADALPAALERVGLEHRLAVASGPALTEAVAAALADQIRFVVAVGDDGTVADALAAVGTEPREDALVLGLVPAGPAGCDLALSFGLPSELDRAVGHLVGDRTYPLDLMAVTAAGRDGPVERVGHNLLQIGLRAAALRSSRRLGGGRLGRFAGFWWAVARSPRRAIRLRVDARVHELQAWDVLVANGQFAEQGLRLSPRSYPGDGVLDVLAFVGPRTDAYRMLPRIFMHGAHLPDPGVRELRARIVVGVETDRPMPVALDGRPLGTTPVQARVLPGRVLLKL
ncbi:MAG: hypothetical protein KatS3mg013_0443 [Actinomycetota bacterium]|nr:MAG: hypothetical protein KatS3mg013_0443 [Actinomycetota bacterium]